MRVMPRPTALLVLVLLSILPAQEELLRRLASPDAAARQEAVATLIRGGPGCLGAYLDALERLPPEVGPVLVREVLPRLDPQAAGPLLLDRFLRRRPAFEAAQRLELDAVAGMRLQSQWLEASARARGAGTPALRQWEHSLRLLGFVGFRPAVDAVLEVYRACDHRSTLFPLLSHTLVELDADQARAEFRRRSERRAPAERLQGLWAWVWARQRPNDEVLLAAFSDPDPAVQEVALRLQELAGLTPATVQAVSPGDARALTRLAVALASPQPDVQVAAAARLVALHRDGVAGAADVLLDRCATAAPERLVAIIPHLAELRDDRRVVPLLLGWCETMRPGPQPWRDAALQALARCADPRVIEPMLALLDRGINAGPVLAGVEGARELHPRLLERLLAADGWEARLPYHDAMERIDGPELARAVVAALPDTTWGSDPRASARANLFGLLRAHPALVARGPMLALLDRPSLEDHLQAASVLVRLGDLTGVQRLVDDVDHPELAPELPVPRLVGSRLRSCLTPEVRRLLLQTHAAATGERRARLREVLAELRDPEVDRILAGE
jgi:hypothetical protein